MIIVAARVHDTPDLSHRTCVLVYPEAVTPQTPFPLSALSPTPPVSKLTMSISSPRTTVTVIALSLVILQLSAAHAHPSQHEQHSYSNSLYGISSFSEHGVEDVGPALANATSSAIDQAQAILSNYTSVLHGVAIPAGLAVTFFGYFLLTPVLFIAAFIIGGGASFIVVSTILSDFAPAPSSDDDGSGDAQLTSPTSAWVSIGAMLFGGALFGFIAMRALPLGMFAIGAALGVIFSTTLRTTLLPALFPDDPHTAFIITAVVLGLLLGLLALAFQKHMLIFSTAFGGALAAVFGIAHFTGHVPSVQQLQQLEQGQLADGWVFLYFAAALLLGLAGMAVQFRLGRDKDLPEYAPYDRRRRFPLRSRSRPQYRDPYWDDAASFDDWDDGYDRRPPPPPPQQRRPPPPPPPPPTQ